MPTKTKPASTTKKTTPTEAKIEASVSKHEKSIDKKIAYFEETLEFLAQQVYLTQKAMVEDLGVNLAAVWERMADGSPLDALQAQVPAEPEPENGEGEGEEEEGEPEEEPADA